MRLLIVDDDPHMRRLLVNLVGLYGVQACLTAGHSKEAAAVLAEEAVDGIILDLMMPDIDGEQFLRALREHPGKRHLPVLIVSGDGSQERVAAIAGLGVFDFVLKPLRPTVAGERLMRFVAHCREMANRS